MTPEEFIAKQKERIAKLDGVFAEAVADTHGVMAERIFVSGQDSRGGAIGKYNTTNDLYVNPNSSSVRRKFSPQGKNGDRKFKDGKPHKTRWFDSYNKFQQTQPFASPSVNLRLSNNLFSDFANSITKRGDLFITTGVKRAANIKKLSGLVNKYGVEVFRLSERESQRFRETLQAASIRVLSGA